MQEREKKSTKMKMLVLLASLALAAVPSAVGQTNDDINTKTLADHPHHNDDDHNNENIGGGGNGEVPFVKNQGRGGHTTFLLFSCKGGQYGVGMF